jgi:hypothetical protein
MVRDLPEDVVVAAPADQEAQGNFGKAKRGIVYSTRFKRTRSPRFHRLVMAIVRDLFENQEKYTDMEVFRAVIKLKCGWVFEEPIITESGTTHWVVKPTDWTNCGEDEFREFFEKLKPIVIDKLGQEGLDQYGAI